MPRAAAARKPAEARAPARKPRAKARKKQAPKPKKLLLTPSEKQKTLFAAALLLTFLLAILIHSGELIHTATGWKIHFHDLKGHLVVSISLPW